MLSPRQIFEDNIRPADLLLKVFRLLEHDALNTEEGTAAVASRTGESGEGRKPAGHLQRIFLGLIRELAEVPPQSIKRSALCNLLRQAVVTASTALETYLPILLQRQSARSDSASRTRFCAQGTTRSSRTSSRTLTFDLDEAVRILVDPDPLFVANKMISSLNFSYLSGKRGIHVTGVLLGARQSVGA